RWRPPARSGRPGGRAGTAPRECPEAVRVRGDPRDRPELVHAASGDDEPVAADLPAPPLGIDPPHLPASQIDPDNLTEEQAHAGRFLSDSLVHEAQPRLVTGPVCGT